jgi:hypothetical protein
VKVNSQVSSQASRPAVAGRATRDGADLRGGYSGGRSSRALRVRALAPVPAVGVRFACMAFLLQQ